jgi:hypothetical protein
LYGFHAESHPAGCEEAWQMIERLKHPMNALDSIDVTDDGMAMLVNAVQLKNALDSMEVTDDGIITLVSCVQL